MGQSIPKAFYFFLKTEALSVPNVGRNPCLQKQHSSKKSKNKHKDNSATHNARWRQNYPNPPTLSDQEAGVIWTNCRSLHTIIYPAYQVIIQTQLEGPVGTDLVFKIKINIYGII